MGEILKIIIADDEQNICDMFRNLIRFDQIGLELVAIATDGEMLLQKIEMLNPDIVVTDICMPKMDGLQVIKRCRENHVSCRFVVVSGYRQFEYAYNALKYNVSDYLLKPVDEKELNILLQKIADEIHTEKEGTYTAERDSFLQSHFMTYIVDQMTREESKKAKADNYEKINGTYMMHVRGGYFRFMYLKLDDVRQERMINEEQTSILEKMRKLVQRHLGDVCYDIAFRYVSDAVVVLLNYDPQVNEEVLKKIDAIFEEGKSITEIFNGLHLTIAVGGAVDELAEVSAAKQQAMAAMFSRLCLGTNRIIYSSALEQGRMAEQCDLWRKEISQAWEQLDAGKFRDCITDMFSRSRRVTTSIEFSKLISDTISISERSAREIVTRLELHYDLTTAAEWNSVLNTNATIEQYRDALIAHIGGDIQNIAELVDKKRARPIRIACDSLQKHYAENHRLEDVAYVAGLSSAYFSTMFSKTVGQTFSEYMATIRIQKACELLSGSDMNIGEIAETLGFPDARYFSKVFRKKVGIKPTEYRRIYG